MVVLVVVLVVPSRLETELLEHNAFWTEWSAVSKVSVNPPSSDFILEREIHVRVCSSVQFSSVQFSLFVHEMN